MMNKRRGFKSDREGSEESPNEDYVVHGSEQKKSRIEETPAPPSRVLHIRNLPLTVSEDELCQLAVPFGRISNMIYARRNNQALLEMEELSDATRMISFYEARPPILQARTCIVQYSRHASLDTRNENAAVVRAIDNANSLTKRDGTNGAGGAYRASSISNNASRTVGMPTNPAEYNSVLHVVLENRTNEPINPLLLFKVFSQSGRILKIVMFTKLKMEHALIEYDTPVSALSAKINLDNRALLGGRYPMRIEFSKMDHLDVRTESNKSRDFDRSPLTEMERYAVDALSLVSDLVVEATPNHAAAIIPSPQQQQQQQAQTMPGMILSSNSATTVLPNQQTTSAATLSHPFHPNSVAGGDAANRGNVLYCSSNSTIPTTMPSGVNGSTDPNANDPSALNNLAAMLCLSRMLTGSSGGTPGTNVPPESWLNSPGGLNNFLGAVSSSSPNGMNNNNFSEMSQRFGGNGSGSAMDGVRTMHRDNSVLIVSGLNESKVDPDSLFTLFGVFGDVQRVKIMFNKKNTALIQFVDNQQALMAKECLNNVVVWDQPLKVNVSRHNAIQMPREDDGFGLTKDYSNTNLHRFKNNYKNVFPPGPVLHFSNIPPEMSDIEITDLVKSRGFEILNVRSLQKENNKRKMALVQFLSTENAIMALLSLHNFKFNANTYLRVSFSSRHPNRSN